MTQREKRLARIVGVVVLVAIAAQGVQKLVVEPLRTIGARLQNARDRNEKLNERWVSAQGVDRAWQRRTARALANEPDEAQLRFLDELSKLLDRHGLTAERTITPRSPRLNRKTEFIEIPVQVRVSARQRQVIQFLKAFYEQPYYAQLETVTLLPDERKAAGGPRGKRNARNEKPYIAAPDTPLTVTLVAKTLVLPSVAKLKSKEFDPAAKIAELNRLRMDDHDAYTSIADVDIFKEHQERPRPVVKPEEKPEPDHDPVVHAPPPRDPREGFERFRLVGTEMREGEGIAYVFDDETPDMPAMTFYAGDDIELEGHTEGTVVLVDRRGMVVQTTQSEEPPDARPVERDEDSAEPKVVNYFYPLGSNFLDREPLDARKHPEVSRKLRLARRD